MTTAFFTSAAFLIALVSVGLTEVIKKNLPEKIQKTWVLSTLNLLIVAGATAIYVLTTPEMDAIKGLVTGVGAYSIAQAEYNFLFKTFTAVIDKLKESKLPGIGETDDKVVDEIANKLTD